MRRPIFLLLALAVLAVIVALPVVAADPSSGPGKSDHSAVTGKAGAPGFAWHEAKVNGKHAGGKPSWAGGWMRVGKDHPGWSQAKADRFKAKFGDCFPPGQCKDKAEPDQ